MKIKPMTSRVVGVGAALVMTAALATTLAWSQQSESAGGFGGTRQAPGPGGSSARGDREMMRQLQAQVEMLERRVDMLEGRMARSDPSILGGLDGPAGDVPQTPARDADGRRVLEIDRIEVLEPDPSRYDELDQMKQEVAALEKTVDQQKRRASSESGQSGGYSGSYRGGRYGRDNTQGRRRRESGRLLADYQDQYRKKNGEMKKLERELKEPRQIIHGHAGDKLITLETLRDMSGILDRTDLGDQITWKGRRVREDATSQEWVVNSVERNPGLIIERRQETLHMQRRIIPAAAILVLLAACATTITAQNQDGQGKEIMLDGEGQRFTEPGPEHDVLDNLRGRWVQEVTFWPEPGVEPAHGESELEFRWTLGGRWIQSSSRAYFGGSLFNGQQILGFDTYRKRYSWFYIDNQSTGSMQGFGSYDKATRTLTIEGIYDDVVLNKRDQPYETWWRFAEDGASYEAGYKTPGPDGKMYQRVHWKARRPE